MTAGAQHSVIPTVALDDDKVTPGVYRFLGVLSAYAERGGYVSASMAELAARLNITRQAVSKGLDILVALGYAETESLGVGRGVRIRLLPDPVIPAARLRSQPTVAGAELETGNYERESAAYAQPTVAGAAPPSQPTVTGGGRAAQPTVAGPPTPARARDNGLSYRESDSMSTATAAASPNGSHVPAAAAAGRAYGNLAVEQRGAAERIATTLYSVAGIPWTDLSDAVQRREIVIAADMATKGANPAEAAAFVSWCLSDDHRPRVTSMRTYETHRASFRVQTSSRSASVPGELGNGTTIE